MVVDNGGDGTATWIPTWVSYDGNDYFTGHQHQSTNTAISSGPVTAVDFAAVVAAALAGQAAG